MNATVVHMPAHYRSRRNVMNGNWDVQYQNFPGYPWRAVGSISYEPGGVWEARHMGRVLGSYFPTRREAFRAVCDADS